MISRKYPSTRLRRLRQSESIIDLTSECAVTKNDLIQPVFVKEGLSDKEPIESMPVSYTHLTLPTSDLV